MPFNYFWLKLADYDDYERSLLISQMSFEKTFGLSTVFIESTLMENGGVPDSANSSTLIKEAIHVISCGYEEKTEWGKEVSIWFYFILLLMYSRTSREPGVKISKISFSFCIDL